MSDNETTGTPTGTQEGASASASGTPAAGTDGGNAAATDAQELESLRAFRAQALAEKSNYEETKRRLADLEAERQRPGWGNPPPTAYDPNALRQQQVAEALATLQQTSPEAVQVMSALAENMTAEVRRTQGAQQYYRELANIPAEDQPEIERMCRERGVMPSVARDSQLARRYEKDRQELAEQRRRLQEQEDKIKRGVVATTSAPAPPAPTGNEVTATEYAKICEDARAGSAEARRKLRDYDEGRLKIRAG